MKVFEQGTYVDEWCGQSDKGDELPSGTYYYVMERSNAATSTGWIYITREQ
jgi:flagellar hook assembly protein FlgD